MLPSDPIMLLSVVNTKLRDRYDSLEALCEDMNVTPEVLEMALAAAGYSYDEDRNQFV